jgi:hypothetical protein
MSAKIGGSDDQAYFHDRAEAELVAAERAEHPRAITAHSLLAGYYLDLAHNSARQLGGEASTGE